MKLKLILGSLLGASLVAVGTILAVKTPPKPHGQIPTPVSAASKPSAWVKVPDVPIQRQTIAASRLSEGMTKKEVEQVMGRPTDVKLFAAQKIEILTYRQPPLVTKVSFVDGYVSGVTVEWQAIATDNLPRFARRIEMGMSRARLFKVMGKPLARRRTNLSLYKLEQLAYVKEGELPINVILRDGRVEGVNAGLENPSKIVKVILPAAPNLSKLGRASQQIRIGMNPQQVMALFGEPTAIEFSQVRQQPVAHLVYTALNTDASTQFTFINNVLTRFSFVPQSHFFGAR